jgi:hypothetical protein
LKVARIGPVINFSLSRSKLSWHSLVYKKGIPFFVKLFSRRTIPKKLGHKSLVEVGKAQESLDALYNSRGFLFLYYFYLLWVYFDSLPCLYYKAQVLCLLILKFVLLNI